MPLPPLLLERLKRRKIIQDVQPDGQEPLHSRCTQIDPLEARYAERESNEVTGSAINEQEEEEEIIAEDYSDDNEDCDDESETRSEVTHDGDMANNDEGQEESSPRLKPEDDTSNQEAQIERIDSVLGCPNKYNIYHNCGQYCSERYSEPETVEPTLQQRKDLAMILRTYPMSNEWTVVYDPGVRTFYFWNIISNLVSWLPPEMNGYISVSADQIRRSMRDLEQKDDQNEQEL